MCMEGKIMTANRKTIPLDLLTLSDDNPRLDIYDYTQDILIEMVTDQQDQIFVLAEDILNYGISPLDLWAVYPSDNGKYRVAEGNRRLSALILLNDPEIIKDTHPRIYSRFTNLLKNNISTPPNQIDCVVFKSWNDTELQHWIQLRHLGLNRGKGLATWDSVQKARYEKKIFGINALLDFWDSLTENGILTVDQISAISKTNWERILNKKGRVYLGLDKSGTSYILPKSPEKLHDFTIRMRKISEKLAHQTVAVVYDNNRIQKLLDEIHSELYGEKNINHQIAIDVSDQNIKPFIEINKKIETDVNDSIRNDNTTRSFQTTQEGTNQRGPNPPRDVFNNSKTVVPYSYSLRSSNHRINSIIIELKRLNVEENPNACGALCRLLFELSSKHYIQKNISGKDETELGFMDALSIASNALVKNGKLSKIEHSALAKDKDHLRLLFNGYMHASNTYPSIATIKSLFKSHKTFIELCLEK